MISPISILYIEDNRMDAMLVKRYVKKTSFAEVKLECVETLAAALASLDAKDFQLVVTDLNLPDSVGMETISELRGQGYTGPLAVSSGESRGLVDVDIFLAADAWLPKNAINADAIEELVHATTWASQANAQLTPLGRVWYRDQRLEVLLCPREIIRSDDPAALQSTVTNLMANGLSQAIIDARFTNEATFDAAGKVLHDSFIAAGEPAVALIHGDNIDDTSAAIEAFTLNTDSRAVFSSRQQALTWLQSR